MVLGLHFLRRMKSRADWDRLYGRWPYMIIWCTGGSKFSVSYFPLPTTQLHHHYSIYTTSTFPSSRLVHCSSLPIYVNHCMPRAAPPPPPARPVHCSSRNLCEPLHASHRVAVRSKGKGMLSHFTDGSLTDYFPL